jgi:hypothetical protein
VSVISGTTRSAGTRALAVSVSGTITGASTHDAGGAVSGAGATILARFVALISPSETLTLPSSVFPDQPMRAKGAAAPDPAKAGR